MTKESSKGERGRAERGIDPTQRGLTKRLHITLREGALRKYKDIALAGSRGLENTRASRRAKGSQSVSGRGKNWLARNLFNIDYRAFALAASRIFRPRFVGPFHVLLFFIWR